LVYAFMSTPIPAFAGKDAELSPRCGSAS